MTDLTLSKTETKLLLAAADRGGAVACPETMKPSTLQRTLGRLVRDGLITSDDGAHRLTPAGYRAAGLRPPRTKRAEAASASTATEPRVTKGTLVLQLLGRREGASLAELVEATGWLPHTTGAALSRLRSSGKALAKSQREDRTTTYRIVPDEPAPARRGREPREVAPAQAAA